MRFNHADMVEHKEQYNTWHYEQSKIQNCYDNARGSMILRM